MLRLGMALGLGLLVGLQRQHEKTPLAGIRTFALITVLGSFCALLAVHTGGWVLGAGLVALAGVIIAENLGRGRTQERGVTTEVAALVMYGIGAYIVLGDPPPAVVAGGVVALLLHFKKPMHRFVSRMSDADLHAIMRFVLISLVILPVLPDETYGPYQVLNPRRVWWIVVLIVGISLTGYVAFKLWDPRGGAVASGLLGGLISSTATTVSFARQGHGARQASDMIALVIAIASAVSVLRTMAEVVVVSPGHARQMLPPMAVLLALIILVCAGWWFRGHEKQVNENLEAENPAELQTALVFAGLYALIRLLVAAAQEHFGEQGVFVAAGLSGLADMDAITLSTAGMVNDGRIPDDLGWRAILLAAASNLSFKCAAAMILGHPALRPRVLFLLGPPIAGAVILVLAWPAR
jgi:uncharacterized membrane protein (DUF4010 family)